MTSPRNQRHGKAQLGQIKSRQWAQRRQGRPRHRIERLPTSSGWTRTKFDSATAFRDQDRARTPKRHLTIELSGTANNNANPSGTARYSATDQSPDVAI